MEEKRLQLIVEEIWPRLKKKHFYPELPMPRVGKIVDSDENNPKKNHGVGLEMKMKQMTINSTFVVQMKDKISEKTLIESLLDHGISHYTFCPWDFHTHLMLYAEAKKVIGDKTLSKQVANYFIDVIADTYCVKKKSTEIPQLHRFLKRGMIEDVITSLYQKIWGIDLGVLPYSLKGKKDEQIVRRLARIPYLDRSRWPESIQRFARFLKPVLFENQKRQQNKGGNGNYNPQGQHDLSRYSYEEIDQGLSDCVQKTMTLSEFREVIQDFSDELQEAGYRMEGEMGRGGGFPIDADIIFYRKLSESYCIPLKKVPLEKRETLYPHSHSPWEVGSPFQDVDIWTSFGKVMPGVTQIWKKEEGREIGKNEGTPDCLIAIDSSGSMINPRRNLSYAVLGAGCAANAYLRNGSKVAVYNFSDALIGGKNILNYTNKPEEIFRTLCKYFGGGTALDVEDFLPLIHKRKNLDLFIITDMKITNLESLIKFLGEISNRITVVHIGENPYAIRFGKSVEKKKNISIFTVNRKEDIPYIVLGKIREYFNPMHKAVRF